MAHVIVAGAAVRAMPGYRVSGDAAVIVQEGGRSLVALIDALGHGPPAAESADIAVAIVRERASSTPAAIVAACHVALRQHRGVAIAVLAIDADGSGLYAGVGNIRTRIVPEGIHHRALIPSAGVVGHQMRPVREQSFKLPIDGLGVLHSDGVGSKIDPLAVERAPIDVMAASLLATWQRDTDDASILLFAHARGGRVTLATGEPSR